MTELMKIQPFIQAYVLAVASILNTEVTIVDKDLIRVGGTGNYEKDIGSRVPHDSFFQGVLTSGKPGIIRNVKEECACISCKNRNECKELANLVYPIFMGKKVIGIMALIAFKEAERESLLKDRKKLEEFLKYMSILIESKIMTDELNSSLKEQIKDVASTENRQYQSTNFIGKSQVVKEILQLIEKVASSDSTILIHGESGTGKEVLAKIIHAKSSRKDKLMVSINCAAIPENLVESELFGHDEGAFTGAKKEGHVGKFERAHKSTIFLDEIGDMPFHIQTKLLRVIQEKSIERLGGKKVIPIDVRIICATHRNLEEMVAEGTFREDLYYRLNVIPITIPALRQRKEDIPLLVDYYINYYNKKLNKKIESIDKEAVDALSAYKWHGNVRELKNIIEYLINIVDGNNITISDLPEQFILKSDKQSLNDLMQDYEKRLLTNLVKNVSTVEEKNLLAQRLKISRATLYRKLDKFKLL